MKTTTVHIRWLIRRDMPEVLAIDRACVGELAWTEDELRRCLRQRNCVGLVAEHGDVVVGFMLYELHKEALGLLHLAVHPDWQRQGVGSQFVARLREKLCPERRTHIIACIRETALPAQLFLRAQGFRCVQSDRGAFPDTREDALLFRYSIPAEPDLGFDRAGTLLA